MTTTLRVLALLLCLTLSMTAQAAARIFFTDLESGPKTGGENNNGVYVTLYGRGFGATQGSVTVGGGAAIIKSWTQGGTTGLRWPLDKVVIQLGTNAATGDIVLTPSAGGASNALPFTVRAGSIYFVSTNGTGDGAIGTPMSGQAAYAAIAPGVTFYFRAGTYNQVYGDPYNIYNYGFAAAQSGTVGNPVVWNAYPGETVTFHYATADRSNFHFHDAGDHGEYITIANFTLEGASYCVGGGGWWEDEDSGPTNNRIIGNIMSADYAEGVNTMTGLISSEGANVEILGNEFKNTGIGSPINNNHIIYMNTGGDNPHVAWNYIHDVRVGHVIQLHQDPFGGVHKYFGTNVRIHDNIITSPDPQGCRGINIGDTANAPRTSGYIYNNLLVNLGQDFSAILAYSGDWKVFNNTLVDIQAEASHFSYAIGVSSGGTGMDQGTIEVRNNIITLKTATSQYVGSTLLGDLDDAPVSNNLYYGRSGGLPSQDASPINADPLLVNAAANDFRLQGGSPARNTGSSTVSSVVLVDLDGQTRPQGGIYDIGAYEYVGGAGCGVGQTCLPFLLSDLDEAALDDFFAMAANQ